MNNRIIRKTMFDSPRICSLNLLERYILIGLLAYVNDRGNGWWSPERIRGSILTGIIKASDKKIEDALRKLADKKIIYPYSEDDIRYFHIIPRHFQILCHNCNRAKFLYITCPHERKGKKKK